MKNYNEFINSSVFKVNQKYSEMQNKTKELFFKCLNASASLEYFKNELEKLWSKLDRSFMEKELAEYEAIIHENNMAMLEIEPSTPEEARKRNMFFDLVAVSVILSTESKFTNQVKRDYKRTLKSPAYQMDKQQYLKMKVSRYDDEKVVTYWVKPKTINDRVTTRHVSMATYNAMIHNTNMTRTAWNTTLNDADYLGYNRFYIPYHSFSCPHCVAHQEKMLTQKEVMRLVGKVAEQRGDILHPNCKCTLLIYDIAKKDRKHKSKLTNEEKEEISVTRQKVNSLTLEKERIATDIKIQKQLGNMDEVDKLNQRRNKVNAQIRELKNSLPTEELQKQVVAINR